MFETTNPILSLLLNKINITIFNGIPIQGYNSHGGLRQPVNILVIRYGFLRFLSHLPEKKKKR